MLWNTVLQHSREAASNTAAENAEGVSCSRMRGQDDVEGQQETGQESEKTVKMRARGRERGTSCDENNSCRAKKSVRSWVGREQMMH